MLFAYVPPESNHPLCRRPPLFVSYYFVFRLVSASKQELADDDIQHFDAMQKNCLQRIKSGLT